MTESKVNMAQTAFSPKTERGLSAARMRIFNYEAADDDVASLTLDSIDVGAGSILFFVNNLTDQALNCELFGNTDNVSGGDSEVQLNFKDEEGTETVGTLAVAAGSSAYIIVTYASYPEAAAIRFYELRCTPDAALGAAGVVTIHGTMK